MGLHGEIQTMPMLDLFQWLELVKKNGKLTVDGSQARQQIFFDGGAIITASSTAYYSTDNEFGVEAIVSDTLKWKRGEFSFTEAPLPGEVANIAQRLSPKQIILKTFQKLDESADAFRQVVAVSSQVGDIGKGYDEVEGLRTAIVSRLLKGDFQIPLLPTVANKIMSITRQDDYSLRDLSEVIITDQVITAQLLKHANSAFYNRGRTIDSISMVVQLLGAQTVTNLVLTLSLRSVVTGRDVFLENKKLVWKRSLACALLARSLSGIAQVDREQAFLCGLMIDFGKIVSKAEVQHAIGLIHHEKLHLIQLDLAGTLQVQQTPRRRNHQIGVLQARNLNLIRYAAHHIGDADAPAMTDQVDGVGRDLLRQLTCGAQNQGARHCGLEVTGIGRIFATRTLGWRFAACSGFGHRTFPVLPLLARRTLGLTDQGVQHREQKRGCLAAAGLA